MRLIACILSSLAFAAPAAALDVTIDTRAALIDAVNNARPGDIIRIAPGEYGGGLTFRNITGNIGERIVIRGRDPEDPPVFVGGNEGMHFVDPSNVSLIDVSFRDQKHNGINIDDGGDMDQSARNIRLSRIRVAGVGPEGNRDGIKLSGLDGFMLRDCTVERWGNGGSGIDMVGCTRGWIVGSTLRHAEGQGASGIQLKGGTKDVSIINCRFEEAGARAVNLGGSTGRQFFRPPLADAGNTEAEQITVSGCLFVGSEAPIAFVSSRDATVKGNYIYRPRKWVLRILQEARGDDFETCGDHIFQNNIIVWHDGDLGQSPVNIGPDTRADAFAFEGNRWTCIDGDTGNPIAGKSRLKLPVQEQKARHGERVPDAEAWFRGPAAEVREGLPDQAD